MVQISLSDFELARVFFAIVLLLASAHGFSYFLKRLLGFPKVIGEIIGGIVLGPSLLGYAFPKIYSKVFQAFESEGQLISILYWIGLVLLMFLSGFEIQKSITKEDKKLITFLLLGATIIPLGIGWLAPSIIDFSPYIGDRGNLISFTIIVAVAIAVTSIPVISKIFIDLGIIETRFAKIVLATATIEDVILWVALAIATGFASGEMLSASSVISKVLTTLGFFVIALLIMPKLFSYINTSRFNLLIKSSATGYTLFLCFLFAAVASILDVNIIFGAFLAGVVIGMTPNSRITAVKDHVREIGLGFFIPIYFSVVGLKLDLIHNFDFPFFLFFLVFAMTVKMFGTIVASRFARQNLFSSLNFGIAMNTRGGPGIVLATVAFDLSIISETFFSILVLVAIVTSLIAGYWFKFVLSKGWDLLN